VVAGGDGSLHLVVQHLHRRGELDDADLALVPLGTGNDLARALDIPLDPLAAAELALRGTPRPLDLVVDDDGGVTVNAVHLGIGAEAAQRSARLKGLLGPLAYPLGAVAAGFRSTGTQLRVEVDGKVLVDDRVLMVGIANGPGIGGGTALHPRAVVDDGLVDVMVSTATGPFARVRFGAPCRAAASWRTRTCARPAAARWSCAAGRWRSTATASSATPATAAPGGWSPAPGASSAPDTPGGRWPRALPRRPVAGRSPPDGPRPVEAVKSPPDGLPPQPTGALPTAPGGRAPVRSPPDGSPAGATSSA
jgi:hypothetical protein